MRLLIDMNLSPAWVPILHAAGYEVLHWSTIGARNADDRLIFEWAYEHNYVIVTLDLNFGTLLAQTNSTKPSVIQIRREDVGPESLAPILFDIIDRYSKPLELGALIVVEESKLRIRMLPLKS